MSLTVTTASTDSYLPRTDSAGSPEFGSPEVLDFAPGITNERDAPARAPFITVVVPVRNEAQCIRHVLGRLLAQEYPADRFEIIVADGESTDETPALVAEIARRHSQVRLCPNPRRWSSAGRNIGVQHARGDILVVVDGHCEIDGGHFLSHLAGTFGTTGADCVGRPQPLDISDATPLQRAIAAARSSWLGHHPDSHVYSSQPGFVPAVSVAVAYRREVFDKIGGFDERFDACEDYEFNHRVDRAGLTCFFTPAVAVRYRPRQSLKGLFRQMVRYGRGRVRLLRKHPDTFSWKTLVPALLVGCGLMGLVAAWMHPWLAAAVWGALAVYVGLVCGVSASIAWRQRDGAMWGKLPWVFFAIHVGAGTGILRECLAGSLGHR